MSTKILTVWIALTRGNKSKNMQYAVPFFLGATDLPHGKFFFREKDCQKWIEKEQLVYCHPAKFVIAV